MKTKKQKGKKVDLKEEETKKTSNEVEETIEEKKEEKIVTEINIDHKDKYIRLYSEYENYRKRTAREKIDIITNASENVLKEVLPVIDDFQRAIANNENVNDASTIKEGFELIYNKLHKTLINQGLKPMDAMDKDFDPDIHEAITKIPAPNEKMKGKVIDVIEKGYTINDKVIRFAKVVVGE